MKKNNKLVTILLASSLLLPGIAPLATGVTSVSAATETVASDSVFESEYVSVMDQVVRHRDDNRASAVAFIERGDKVTFVEAVNNTWFKVKVGDVTGYVLRGNLTSQENFDGEAPKLHDLKLKQEETAEEKYTVAVKTAIRTSDSERYRPLTVVDRGETVEYLGTTVNNNWFKVKYGETTGFINRADVTTKENFESGEGAVDLALETEEDTNMLEAMVDSSIRTQNGNQYRVINELPRGSQVKYLGTTKSDKNWFKVELDNGDVGYVFRGDLTKVEVAETLEIESAKAINAKTIEVKFNKAVEDTSKATVKLSRGTFAQNATVKWSDDNQSVTLEVPGKLQTAEYTVTVTGLSDDALTATTKVEAQKVDSIEILDDIAVLSQDGKSATVGYQVKDQYGEDITETTSLTTNDGENIEANAKKGVVELNTEGKKAGDLIPVVLIHQATGKTATQAVKLSKASAVEELSISGVYNKDGKELNEDATEDFYLVLNLKDQYGKEILDSDLANKLLVTVANEKVITAAKGTVEKMKIDGDDQLVLPINVIGAGSTNVLLISSTTGNTANFNVEVAETTRTDSVQALQPEIAVAKEEILIPLSVQDKEGNLITDLKVLKDDTKGIKVSGIDGVSKNSLVIKDEKLFVKLNNLNKGFKTLVVTTSTQKVSTLTFEVKEEAKARAIRGLKKPLVLKANQEETIKLADLVIEDQYGRKMKNPSGNITVETDNKDIVKVEDTAKVTGLKNGTTKLTITLDEKTDSSVKVDVRVTDGKEYDSYSINEIGLTQALSDAQAFTVKGMLNGGSLNLDRNEFTATITGGKGVVTVASDKNEFTVTEENLNANEKDGRLDTEFTLHVTINATGEKLTEKFVVSAKPAKVQEFFFTETSLESDYKDAKELTAKELTNVDTVMLTELDGVNVASVDQYGNKEITAIPTDANVTITPKDRTKVNITGNGTSAAKAVLAGDTKEAELTVSITVGNATETLNVTLK